MHNRKLIVAAATAIVAVTGGAVAGAMLGTPSISSAQAVGATTDTTAAEGSTEAAKPKDAGHDETALTGDIAEKVKAAALAAVPGGTIIRVETDSDGSPYEAHVKKADGSEAVVKVNDAFTVTTIEDHPGKGERGHGGRPGGHKETELTGETADKVKAAALEAVPGGTVLRVESESADGGAPYEAHVKKADGTEVEVNVDAAFKVTSVEEHPAGGHR
jgi:uncharacterized membrane protein YkoI